MSWEKILEHAKSGDVAREHRAIVQSWTLLRDEGFPHPNSWSPVKLEAVTLLDKLHQKFTDDAEGFVRDLSRLEDAILRSAGARA